MNKKATVVAVLVACWAWSCSRGGATHKNNSTESEAPRGDEEKSTVVTCEKALQKLESLDLRGWTGLPKTCTREEVTAVFAARGDEGGTFHLGSEYDSAAFYLLDFPNHSEPLQMWLVGDDVRLLETEYPELVGGVSALMADLGKPEATLEFAWNVLKLKGELVWPSKGITLFINPENQAVLRVAVYEPTTLDHYQKHLRVDRTTHEL